MAILRDILFKVNIRAVFGDTGVEVRDLQVDSRNVKNGAVFIAIKGFAVDGHQFIDEVKNKGIQKDYSYQHKAGI